MKVPQLFLTIGLLACGSRKGPAPEIPPRPDGSLPVAEPPVVPFPDAGSLTGRVVLDNRPVELFGVTVSSSYANVLQPNPVRFESADGRFTVSEVVPGVHDIIVTGPGFSRKVLVGVNINKGGVTTLGDVKVLPGFTVKGVVNDTNGVPVSGANVSLIQGLESEDALISLSRGNFQTITDSRGRFKIVGFSILQMGSMARITARSPTRGLSLTENIGADNHDLIFHVMPSGVIEGTVSIGNADLGVAITPVQKPRSIQFARVRARSYSIELPEGEYIVQLMHFSGSGSRAQKRVVVAAGDSVTINFP